MSILEEYGLILKLIDERVAVCSICVCKDGDNSLELVSQCCTLI